MTLTFTGCKYPSPLSDCKASVCFVISPSSTPSSCKVRVKWAMYVVAKIKTSSLDSFVSGGTDGKVLCSSKNACLRVCTRLLSRAALAAAGRPLPPRLLPGTTLERDRASVRRLSVDSMSGLGLELGLDVGLSSITVSGPFPLSMRIVCLPTIGTTSKPEWQHMSHLIHSTNTLSKS